MGRTLIYGLDGRTPIVSESSTSDETLALLVEAFGFATGLLWARARGPLQVEMLMDESRQKIVQGVLAMDGAAKAIEERFNVILGRTPDGQLACRPKEEEDLPNPPGPPVPAGDLYR